MPTTPVQGVARAVGLRQTSRPTQPSLPRNPPPTTGPQGTPGGVRAARPGRSRNPTALGTEKYLWALVILEIAALGGLRNVFRRYHGG